ncbi:MAG: Eco29kI family restriction endonuclease [Phycisphaerae bacterium]
MNSEQGSTGRPAVGRFEFDLATPFFDQLLAFFDDLGAAPLTEGQIGKLQPLQGVYGLLWRNRVVYVGKSDGPLTDRLTQHRVKLSGRQNIHPEDVSFRAAYLAETWVPLAPEAKLIRHYQRQGLCEWNGNGFGPHDPGRNREETDKPPDGFDSQFPIRIDFPTKIPAGDYEANDLLQRMKAALPYTFRYETDNPRGGWRAGSSKYNGKRISVATDNMPANEFLTTVAEQLGPTWQATAFPSHLILYEERRNYTYGNILWPKSAREA